jgi:nitrite reductase/ring-hydroxylating ferredoxin subunit
VTAISATGLDLADSVDVCALSDLRPGRIREVLIGRLRAAAALHDGRVYVFQMQCPHRGGPLTRGAIRAPVSAELPGKMVLDADHPVVTCPWHNFEYSLDTGEALWNPALCIRVFPNEVVDGRVRAWENAGSGGSRPEARDRDLLVERHEHDL